MASGLARLTPLARALRLATPAAVASLVVALFATTDPKSATLALGVACGVLAGAAAASIMPLAAPSSRAATGPSARPERRPPVPASPLPLTDHSLGQSREILKRLPQGLVLLDSRGEVVFTNNAAEEDLGVALAGRHYSATLRAPGLVDAVARALEDGVSSKLEFSVRRGQERHMAATVTPLSKSHPYTRALITFEDNTRIRRAEQLHRDFVANASHELRTPLASISGVIETLQISARDDPAAQERFLKIMAQQTDRMRRLVEDLMSLNRIELNEHVPPRDLIALNAPLDDAAALTTPPERADALTIAPLPPRTVVRGDHRELTQLFANLLNNAFKYGGDAPITVKALTDPERPNWIGLAVQDQGPGIPKEHLPRLTERFYRVDTAISRNKGGTGLGLAIVKHIAARHRGELTVDSELGRGSRFTVWLPLVDSPRNNHSVDASPQQKQAVISEGSAET
ncbi:MAG: PAS domain-containing protein [Rhodobacteraceae bacterium]|nr:PAS domain-containing protein [Paracoccaceae bacterium]